MIKQKYALIAALFGLLGGALSGVIGTSWAGRNGSGTYSLPSGNPVVTGTQISSTWANNTLTDIANALTASIAKDGQTVPTANLPMGGFHHTGVADASARNQYPSAGQVQDNYMDVVYSVTGADTITGQLIPAPAAYADGMRVTLFPAGDNTGAATLALNGLTAHSIVKGNGTALAAHDLLDGIPAELVYDLSNTRWSLLNPQTTVTGISPSDLAHLSTTNAFTAAQSVTVADDAAGTIYHATTGAVRIFPYLAAAGGGYIDATDPAISVGAPLKISATTLALSGSTAITLNGVDATDFARLSQLNTFTGTRQTIKSTAPIFQIWETGVGTDQAIWDFYADAEAYVARLDSDDQSHFYNWLTVTRSGTGAGIVADAILLSASSIQLNGVDSSTYMIKGNNLSDLTNAGTARTNLGLGSMATQASSAVSISGGTIAGAAIDAGEITTGTLALGRGGTGQTTQAGITRQNTLAWTIASDPGGTPSGSPGDVFAYY